MGVVQAVGSAGSGSDSQKTQFQPLITRQNSWFNLYLDELESHIGGQGKALGSMNLDDLLKSMSSAEATQPVGAGAGDGSSALQKQASINRVSGKRTVDEVWKDIQRGQKVGNGVVVKSEKETTWGEMTLEDFLSKAGAYSEDSELGSAAGFDAVDTSQSLSAQFTLSPAPSGGALSDAPILGWKTGAPDTVVERKLKRKIKNRESAARSRARKQAYHNELIGKVSRLEMDNIKLKKEKEFNELLRDDFSDEVKYQLRRTSSTSF